MRQTWGGGNPGGILLGGASTLGWLRAWAEPSVSLTYLCSKNPLAKRQEGLMFEELGWHLALLPTESDDTIKRFPLHFPGTRNSRGAGGGVVFGHSKSHQANA